MHKLVVLAAVCALAACSDSKTVSHTPEREDRGVLELPDASDSTKGASAESSRIERAPGVLAKPPTKLPDDLRPPK